MDYFKGCSGEEACKARYKELAKKHHPDKGGDAEIMKQVNSQFDTVKKNDFRESIFNNPGSGFDSVFGKGFSGFGTAFESKIREQMRQAHRAQQQAHEYTQRQKAYEYTQQQRQAKAEQDYVNRQKEKAAREASYKTKVNNFYSGFQDDDPNEDVLDDDGNIISRREKIRRDKEKARDKTRTAQSEKIINYVDSFRGLNYEQISYKLYEDFQSGKIKLRP